MTKRKKSVESAESVKANLYIVDFPDMLDGSDRKLRLYLSRRIFGE
jgi:hypothetical protein